LNRSALGALAAAATGVQVGAAIVATRYVAADISSASLAFLRYAIGVACVAPAVAMAARVRFARADILPIAALGIGQFGILIALLNYGLRSVPAGRGALIFASFPLITLVVAALLGHERVTVRKISGILATMSGVALALGDKILGAGSILGELTILASAAVGAVCSVLYRPHPWRATAEGEADFFSQTWRHVIMAPDMADYYRRHRREPAIIHLADYEDTHVTLSAVDAVISPLSTILLEAALHGKPILAYLPDEDVQRNIAMFSMAKSVHFRDFFERVDCMQCPRREDLVDTCRALLELAERPETADRLRRQCEFFVSPSERSYAAQLDELIRSLGSASSMIAWSILMNRTGSIASAFNTVLPAPNPPMPIRHPSSPSRMSMRRVRDVSSNASSASISNTNRSRSSE
jgi:hypothetical protein